MKKLSFAQKMVVSLISGLVIGLVFLLLRQHLSVHNPGAWSAINQWLFADITAEGNENALGLFYIVGQVFVRSLQLVIVPMVFTSITLAMVHIKDTEKLGRISFKTIRGFLTTSIAALLMASIIGYAVMKLGWFNVSQLAIEGATGATGSNPLNVLLNMFPNNLAGTFTSNTSVLAIVFLSVCLGLIINRYHNELTLMQKLVEEINKIVTVFLNFVIQTLAPVSVALLLIRTIASYGVDYLKPAAIYMLVTTFSLLLFLTVGYALFIQLMVKINPLPFVRKISEVAIFGFSTSSSAATLPLNMKVAQEELGVDKDITSFVLPLGMTINMNGTAIMQVIAAIFVASSAGYQLSYWNILTISVLALVASVGTPAAPGAGGVILFTILSGMGYSNPASLAAYALILAINRPIEMLVTALNVVGDSATAIYVANSENQLDTQTYFNEAVNANAVEA
ncbi:dicarboxylate/amino acid:cation symporter [Tuanshanicoccus lijuaniae]|uniref:dicarboxylate/amino acid:cation symporter n=1 Tax=Aerococcaceae bacterium zg-1292 TaxID=2774330 RepID=UPI0040646319